MKIRRAPYREWLWQFDIKDPVIALKIGHVNNVIQFAKMLSNLLGLSKDDEDLAVFIAQHHDDGRFVQWRDYHTLRDGMICSDGKKYPHAQLSLELLFEDGNIKKYAPEITDEEYKIVYKAIEQHGSLMIDSLKLTDRELLHCQIIRDADMLDNLVNVMVKESMPTLLECRGSTIQELWSSRVSDEVFETFVAMKSINYGIVDTSAEWWLTMVAYVFNLTFVESMRIVRTSKCIKKIFNRVDGRFKINQTNNKMRLAYTAVEAYIDKKISI